MRLYDCEQKAQDRNDMLWVDNGIAFFIGAEGGFMLVK